MAYELIPFTEEHLHPAVELFQQSYRSEQRHSPLLPSRALADPGWIGAALQAILTNPSVVVIERSRLLAYMVTGDQFAWKGQQAALVPIYGHSAIETGKQALYQKMYQFLAREWINQQCHLHLIGHFAHDILLRETLYYLGFGAIIAERLRDGAAIYAGQDRLIKEEQDISKLVDLHIEHIRYYPQAPIFLARSIDRQEALADLEAHTQNGDIFFVSSEQDNLAAYLIVGESTIGAEGFLLQQTNTAQIKSAYTQPGSRGQGMAAALLQSALLWVRQQGYDRVFVEHETANLAGGKFWERFFSPYLYFSMRYVDNTL